MSTLDDFAGADVADEGEALTMLGDFFASDGSFETMIYQLSIEDSTICDAAFEGKYGMPWEQYIIAAADDKSVSMSLSINDRKENGDAVMTAAGSNAISVATSRTLAEFLPEGLFDVYHMQNGDNFSRSDSVHRSINISGGSIEFGDYNVAGTLKLSFSNSSRINEYDDALTELGPGNGTDAYSSGIALSISDGTKGMKLLFSCAQERSVVARSVSMSVNTIYSDIEVYGNDDQLLYKFHGDNIRSSMEYCGAAFRYPDPLYLPAS